MEPRHLQKHRHGLQKDRWLAVFWVRPPIEEKNVSVQEINRVAEQKLFEWNGRKKDGLEFMNINKADRDSVEYEFDIDKWLQKNFSDLNPSWQPPVSIAFKYTKPIPHFVYVDGPWHDLRKAVTDKFIKYIEKNK